MSPSPMFIDAFLGGLAAQLVILAVAFLGALARHWWMRPHFPGALQILRDHKGRTFGNCPHCEKDPRCKKCGGSGQVAFELDGSIKDIVDRKCGTCGADIPRYMGKHKHCNACVIGEVNRALDERAKT